MSIIEHLVTFLGKSKHFSGKNGALLIQVEYFSGKTKE